MLDLSDSFGRNLARQLVIPSSRRSALTSVGVGIFSIALILAGSATIPSDVTLWPMKETSFSRKQDFLDASYRFRSRALSRKAFIF